MSKPQRVVDILLAEENQRRLLERFIDLMVEMERTHRHLKKDRRYDGTRNINAAFISRLQDLADEADEVLRPLCTVCCNQGFPDRACKACGRAASLPSIKG